MVLKRKLPSGLRNVFSVRLRRYKLTFAHILMTLVFQINDLAILCGFGRPRNTCTSIILLHSYLHYCHMYASWYVCLCVRLLGRRPPQPLCRSSKRLHPTAEEGQCIAKHRRTYGAMLKPTLRSGIISGTTFMDCHYSQRSIGLSRNIIAA